MNPTKIGYVGTGADGRPVLPQHVRTWSPGGFGCSNGCDGCYARKLTKRFGPAVCPDCRAFEVHLHPERLGAPARAKTPYIVLVNFFADTFDLMRPEDDVRRTIEAAKAAPQHTYVWLSKRQGIMAGHLEIHQPPDNWYCGLTVRCEDDLHRPDGRNPFFEIPGNLWISYEPAIARVAWEFILGGVDDQPCGIIIGHDNRKGAPGTETLDHIADCVQACKAAGIRWFVKQIYLDGVFLRASKPEEYAQFPTSLSMYARLPWSAPIGE